jgi:subtilisin family serine protease
MEQAGTVSAVRPLWIINAVAAAADPAAIAGLAARPDVAAIRLDASRPLIQLPAQAEKLAEIWQTTATAADEPWGIARVQAPHAWQGLGIDGSGVTVGIMDSGVDWLHPDLLPNYRGSQGGVVNHSGSWYDAVVPTTTVPHDVLGHGTHVAGSAVGQNGIGVAPGASWIAVNIASPGGLIYDSDAHAAFQWLLAPAGNPALAPDVVNGSWSGPGFTTAFLPDIQALEAAGIITVFAAGNAGPDPETLGAPASYTQTIAAGAQDDRDDVTWFSSRGPSPLHADYHPHLIAPGARIYSSLPGGRYGYYNGTSMAAPHTTGAVALILSADPTLSRQAVTRILTETAVPISTTHPNMDSGWGRLNAYQAAAQAAQHGVLTGLVRENGLPLPGILVTITTATGYEMGFETDENGRYTAPLQAGTYQITAAPFGFAPLSLTNVTLTTGTTTTRDLSLTRLPSGTLIVQLLDAESNLPVRGTIDILLTPLTLETDAYGVANVKLPAGNYTLRVRTTGYEIAYLDVTLPPDQNAARTIPLTPGKKVLLVDTGGWYYRSYRAYFADSLIRLGYAFDTHEITNPIYPAFPDQSIINNYDMLIWSSPLDSPGYIGANEVITDYLGHGGSLFISGQDVGYYDGYGFYTQVWWYRDLQANLLGEIDTAGPITGSVDTDYAGLAFTLNTVTAQATRLSRTWRSPAPTHSPNRSFTWMTICR